MVELGCQELPVDAAAARLAVEWKALFAAELHTTAQRLAGSAKQVTADHYRQALSPATMSILNTINGSSSSNDNDHRRIV